MRKYLKQGQYSIDEQEILGKGSFGKVYRGYDHTNSKWVAIKSIDLQMLQKYGDQMKTIVCNQITVMRKFTKKMKELSCPYLVKHEDCFRTDTNVYIVMELCEGGTLNDLLNKSQISQENVKVIIKHLLIGLQYLDALNISHRDLKPQNIFIFSQFVQGKDQVYYKIGDFGFAAQKQSFNQILGTYPFMAPQIYNRQNYTSKVDVWSLGVITYQLLFKQLYFIGKNKWEIQKKVKETPFFLAEDKVNKISSDMQKFIGLCLTKLPSQRPSASQLLQSPLFQPKQDDTIFDALDCQLQFCILLRTLAEQICQFGSKFYHHTQFMQMYFLKKAYSISNLLTYSITNKQNYLNIESDAFNWLTSPSNTDKYKQLSDRIQKECILITSVFESKNSQFIRYVEKFKEEDREAIVYVIGSQQIYRDIEEDIYKQELRKWVQALEDKQQFASLKVKCQKLLKI